MPKYFGTDGIRGVAGSELDAALAYRAGFALACILGAPGRRPAVCIGRDTRISGDMLESALSSGLMAGGADTISLGVVPTPAVALLTASDDTIDAGIVISASHNPFYDNGIKIFGGFGFKLTDEQEAQIESYIDSPPLELARTGADIGRALPRSSGTAQKYVDHIISCAGGALSGLRAVIDCANGAASATAPLIFNALGLEAEYISASPDGVNINAGCGSTHIEALSAVVAKGGYDIGIAFDGDADRCLMVDAAGKLIDGDITLGVIAGDMHARGTLRRGVVGTIVTNLGLKSYLGSIGVEMPATAVGDRYVLEEMRRSGHNIGGEQSGHVILSDAATTGDGQLTAVSFLRVMKTSGRTAAQLASQIELFPQITVNVNVPGALKAGIAKSAGVLAVADEVAAAFGERGRIIVRPSGTEPKVRVMVEGPDIETVKCFAEKAANAIRRQIEA